MRTILTTILAAALATAVAAEDKKDDKNTPPAVGVALIRADGFEVGADFQTDARAARDKYTPKAAPKGVLGGTIVQVDGVVAHVTGEKQIQLASGNEWMILAKGKVEGEGPFATVTVRGVSVGVNGKLVVLEGDITRRKEQQ